MKQGAKSNVRKRTRAVEIGFYRPEDRDIETGQRPQRHPSYLYDLKGVTEIFWLTTGNQRQRESKMMAKKGQRQRTKTLEKSM